MNEELQSANEELGVTREELTAVHAQLREKIDHLKHVHEPPTYMRGPHS